MKPQKQGRPKKQCFFKANDIRYIDFNDVKLLQKFMTESGKILPARITGVSAVFQRQLASAVKTARHAGLIAARQSY